MQRSYFLSLTGAFVLLSASLVSAQTPAGQGPAVGIVDDYNDRNYVVVSGAVGGAFGGDLDDGEMAFDGAIAYLHRGIGGIEFIGSFTPDLQVGSIVTLEDTSVNSYMFNGIASLPLGFGDNWMPYVSGGVGIITLRNDFEVDFGSGLTQRLLDENQFGGNVGVGVMGFANHIGVRADVRYYTGIGNDRDNTGSAIDLVNFGDNINFWRSTVGLSFRW